MGFCFWSIFCDVDFSVHKRQVIYKLNMIFSNTVKPVLGGHLKIDKTNVRMENGSLMKVKSIAE